MDWDKLVREAAGGFVPLVIKPGTRIVAPMLAQLLGAVHREDEKAILRSAIFAGTVFEGEVNFHNVVFEGGASFAGAVFKEKCSFNAVRCAGRLLFDGATFQGLAYFSPSGLSGDISFNNARFEATAQFVGFECRKLDFYQCTFANATWFTDLRVHDFLLFVDARFEAPVPHFNVGSKFLSLLRTNFAAGAILRLHGGRVDLSGAQFGGPSFLMGDEVVGQFLNQPGTLAIRRDADRLPAVKSLESVDCTNLNLRDVDVSECRFATALKIDALKLKALCLFDKFRLTTQNT